MVMYAGPQQSKKSSWIRPLLGIVVLAALAVGVKHWFFGAPPAAPEMPAPAVTVQQVATQDVPLVFEYPARLAGSREVEVRARVGGILLKRHYTEGHFVHQGDVLVQIDPAPYRAALAEAEATYAQSLRDYHRAVTLKKQKALSPREFDEAEATYRAAKARVESAKIDLGFTTVRAPISGYTSEEANPEGTLVAANDTLLTRLTQLDPIYVEFAYPDSDAMMQREGVANGSIRLPKDKNLHVDIVLGDGTTFSREATVRFTDSFINTATGTVQARAVLSNKDQALMPGQFVQARLKGLTQIGVIAIPEQAIMQGPDGMFVYTIDADNKASITPVTLGLLNDGHRIITSGLKDGDRVVVEGMIKVRPGAPVNPTAPGDGDNAAAAASPAAKG